jgi:hypothetical protein
MHLVGDEEYTFSTASCSTHVASQLVFAVVLADAAMIGSSERVLALNVQRSWTRARGGGYQTPAGPSLCPSGLVLAPVGSSWTGQPNTPSRL